MASKVLLVLSALLGVLSAYKHGAPPKVCDDMIPHHNNAEVQSSVFPYEVTLDNKEVAGDGTVLITLSGDEPFKGFFVQVRNKEDEVVGRFTASDESKTVDCFDKESSAVTHINADDKLSTILKWTAPKEAGEYKVKLTIVKDYEHFWHDTPATITVV